MRKSPLALLSIAAASALVLTGCGTTEDSADAAGSDSAAAVSVVDDRGETIELDAPATKVVALEWNAAENLVALGVQPVGVADVEGYATWVKAEDLDDDVTDVGTRGEPSVDAIAGLAPDLIVTTTDTTEAQITQLEELAPVLVIRGADASNAIGQMEKNVETIAAATGTEDEATELIADFEAKVAEGTAAIEAAGLAGAPFAMSDGWSEGGQVSIRPYLTGALLSDVTEELGLVNAWTGEGDADYGLGSTDVEALTALPADTNYLYIASDDADIYTQDLAANPIWTSLGFVQAGKVERLPDGIWMFGGPSSMEDFIDSVVETLTK